MLTGPVAVVSDIVSSAAIILCNKLLMKTFGFRYPITLTSCHYAVTAVASICLCFATKTSADAPPKTVPLAAVAAFALLGTVGIMLANASLLLNSIAFYQIVKLAGLPLTACLEVVTRTSTYTAKQCACFAVVLAGVAVTIRGTLTTSPVGTIVAAFSVLTTSLHQFYCGVLQTRYQVSPNKLLARVAPLKALALFVVAPALDGALFGSRKVFAALTVDVVKLIGTTCALAVVVNIAQYTVVHFYGAGTFQAVNQMKTVLVVYGGSLMFDGMVALPQAVGTVLSIAGVLLLLASKQQAAVRVSKTGEDEEKRSLI